MGKKKEDRPVTRDELIEALGIVRRSCNQILDGAKRDVMQSTEEKIQLIRVRGILGVIEKKNWGSLDRDELAKEIVGEIRKFMETGGVADPN